MNIIYCGHMLTIASYSTYQSDTLKETIFGNLMYEHLQLSEMPLNLTSLLKSCWCFGPPGYELIATSEGTNSDVCQSDNSSKMNNNKKDSGCIFKHLSSANTLHYATLASNPDGRVNLGSYIDNQNCLEDIFEALKCNKKKKKKSKSSKDSSNIKKDKNPHQKHTHSQETKENETNSHPSKKKYMDQCTLIPNDVGYQSKDLEDLVIISKSHHHTKRSRRSRSSVGALLTIHEEETYTDDTTTCTENEDGFSDVGSNRRSRKDYGSMSRRHSHT